MAKSSKSATGPLSALTRMPASDVKRHGWRGVVRALRSESVLLITNHSQPEAVVLDAETYADLLERAGQAEARVESELDALRHRFDERLATLRTSVAGDRLRAVMDGPTRLRGKVKAGAVS